MDDATAIRNCQAGDNDAFRHLVERYERQAVAHAVAILWCRDDINPKQIGLIGHSEGGMIAPMVAARSEDVAFIVMLAGLGQTGADVLYMQTELLQKANGVPAPISARSVALIKAIHQRIKRQPLLR